MPRKKQTLYRIHAPRKPGKYKSGSSSRRFILRDTLKNVLGSFSEAVPCELLKRCKSSSDTEHLTLFLHLIRQRSRVASHPYIHHETLQAIAGDNAHLHFERLLSGWVNRSEEYRVPRFDGAGNRIADGECKRITITNPRLLDPRERSELVNFYSPLSQEVLEPGREIAVEGLRRVHFHAAEIYAQYQELITQRGDDGFKRWCEINGVGEGNTRIKATSNHDKWLNKITGQINAYSGLLCSMGINPSTGKRDPWADVNANYSVDSFGERLHWCLTSLPKAAREHCYIEDANGKRKPIELLDLPCAQLSLMLAIWSASISPNAATTSVKGDSDVIGFVVDNAAQPLPDDAPPTLRALLNAQRRGDDLYFALGGLLGFDSCELTDELRSELKTAVFAIIFSRQHLADVKYKAGDETLSYSPYAGDSDRYLNAMLDRISDKQLTGAELSMKERLFEHCPDLVNFLIGVAGTDLGLTRDGKPIRPGTNLVALTQRLESRIMNTAVVQFAQESNQPITTLHDALVLGADADWAHECLRDAMSVLGLGYAMPSEATTVSVTSKKSQELSEVQIATGIVLTTNNDTNDDDELTPMPFDLEAIPMLPKRTGGVRRTHGNRPSLAETHPEIARTLVDPEVGWNVTPGSNKKLNWCCGKCEHNWTTTANKRTSGRGCPACSNKVTTETNCLATTHPELSSGLVNPDDGFKVTPGSRKKLKWCCRECDHTWDATVADRTGNGRGCPACAGRVTTETNCLATTHPELASELVNTDDAYKVTPGSRKKLNWKCSECDHTWDAKVYNRTGNGRGCPACAGRVTTETNCLATTHPELASELVNPEDGYKVTPGSVKKLNWCCSKCEHTWNASANHRTSKGTGCPKCAGHVVTETNCLATTHPELARELANPDDAYKVLAKSNKKLKWCCRECNHNWTTAVANRTKGTGCPKCAETSRMNRWSAKVAAAMGVNHATEVRFDDCRDQRPLPFDLAIYSTDGQVLCLFEFQGMQHFKPVKWSSNMTDEQAQAKLEAVQRRDQIKRDYARANNIKLIEIVAFATDRRDGEATFKRILTEAIQEQEDDSATYFTAS